jgi:hypothetical protein
MVATLVNAARSSIVSRLLSHRQERAVRRLGRRRLLVATGLTMLILTLMVPAVAVGAQSAYPPNTVVSTYFDARYGEVSVVTDASGNLIDINAQTGQRIYPVYADDNSAYTGTYVAPAYTNTYAAPAYVAPSYASATTYGYSTVAGYDGSAIYLQYTDNNSNCADGQVTQTASGFYCTATGAPAFSVG